MIIHSELKQGTVEWLELRLGKFTGSDAKVLNSKGLGFESLCFEKAGEIITGKIQEEGFISADMLRGRELEPVARAMYELQTGSRVTEVGFIQTGEYSGFSPDGLVGDDGIIEIKCPGDRVFIEYAHRFIEKINPSHMAQMQWAMLDSGRSWVDYVIYNPNIMGKLLIKRINRDDKMCSELEASKARGIEMVQQIIKRIKE